MTPEQRWEFQLRRKAVKYGLTVDELRAMGHTCGICGKELGGDLRVDHDHNSGRARGVLCNNCNTGLGMFADSISSLRSAIVYLSAAAALDNSANV